MPRPAVAGASRWQVALNVFRRGSNKVVGSCTFLNPFRPSHYLSKNPLCNPPNSSIPNQSTPIPPHHNPRVASHKPALYITGPPRIRPPHTRSLLVNNYHHDEAQDPCVRASFFEHIAKVKWETLDNAAQFSHVGQRGWYMELVGGCWWLW